MAINSIAATTLSEAKHYLLDILGPEAFDPSTTSRKSSGKNNGWATLWPGAEHLPFFLQSTYTYYLVKLFGHPCLLMLAITPDGETPAVVRKHWQQVSKHFEGEVIYLVEAVSSYNRKRLIEQRVPFLVPGNQLYLPTLGIDLREYFKQGRPTEITQLSAPAQALLLREILQHDCAGLPAKDLAQMLGYSPMTITRVINELTDRQLARAEKVGREKHLSFPTTGRTLWQRALPALQSPVTKRIWVVWRGGRMGKAVEGHITGESALAHYTDLAATGIDQWAISTDMWAALAKRPDVQILASEPANTKHPPKIGQSIRKDREAMELELWAYHPSVMAHGKPCVDPLSLWLSLTTNTDERVEMARESLLEQVWSTLSW
ncbi:MAG: hypothetical protein MJA28_05780 [Gammaproteobacteria bacterium]|nr:hypothetical protein [Gammaproteobacteria bacterium]